MILSRRVALNGNQLDQIDSAIVIRKIEAGTTKRTVNATAMMGGSGQRITAQHWDTLEVSVTFAIDIHKKALADRREVFDDVIAWAMQKGWLTVNWLPDKGLRVDEVVLPASGDLFEWTNDFTIVFRAYAVPFWQDDTATTATGASITVPGQVETVCDAEITNGSGSTINTLSVGVGDSSMSFTNLGLADGERLVIGHGDDGMLYIRIYTGASYYRRVMDKRTGGSSDDLYVKPGARSITVTGGTVTKSISCRGRYV